MNIDFGKLVEAQTRENMKVYEAGHAEGYKLGFSEGIKEAQKIIDATLGPMLKPSEKPL